MEIHCKAGNVELSREEVQEIYDNKKYVVTSSAIWQPHFSQEKDKFHFSKVLVVKGMARRGRFYKLNAKDINSVLGYDCLTDY